MRYLLLALLSLGLTTPVFAQEDPTTGEVVSEETLSEEADAVEGGEVVAEDPAPVEESPAEAEGEELSVDEVVETVGAIKSAIDSGAWGLVVGLVLSLLVAVLRKVNVLSQLPDEAVPWVTMGLALAGTVGVSLVGGVAISEALLAGLTAGLAAIGGWEMLLKHVKALHPPEEAAAG